MTARRVSVIVPTCDRILQLRRALESIRAVEAPDVQFQIIVADNGSEPGVSTAAAEFGAVYLKVEERGVSTARNAAMAAATGDYLAFLDDDDAWLEGHIRPHLKLFEEQPDLQIVFGQVISTNEKYVAGADPWPADLPADRRKLLRQMLGGYFPQVGSVLVRRSVLKSVGLFDVKLIGGEDLDWFLRIVAHGKAGFVRVPCILFTHREGGTFDELQLKRIKYDRLVFNRYAWRWWRLWDSPGQLSRAYSNTVMYYYRYFVDAAANRAAQGKRREALVAIWRALGIFPLRGTKHLLTKTALRRALFTAMFSYSVIVRMQQLPVWLCMIPSCGVV
jgi:glycosyltransferase involved in cell wall biosynthesis